MHELMKTVDYSTYSLNVLKYLNTIRDTRVVSMNRHLNIVEALVGKYFENKQSVNIYELLLGETFPGASDIDKMNFCISVLAREFSTGAVQPLPIQYQSYFFKFLINSVRFIEETVAKMGGSIEWQLGEIPVLMDYLVNLDSKMITSPSVRQEINDLVSKIKLEIEKRPKEQENKKEGNSSKFKKSKLLPSKKTVASKVISDIPYLKLQKSKLTNKNLIIEALHTFGLYGDEDKLYLLNLVHKKGDTLFKHINEIDAFDFLIKHYYEFYSPWKLLYTAFINSFAYFNAKKVLAWQEYFKAESFEDIILAIKDLYLSYNGATEDGFYLYISRIFWGMLNIMSPHIEDKSDCLDYIREFLKEQFYSDTNAFCECNSTDLMINLQGKEQTERTITNWPIFKNDDDVTICEFITTETFVMSDLDRYMKLYSIYRGLYFSFEGMYLKDASFYVSNEDDIELKLHCRNFLNYLNTISFDTSTVKALIEMKKKSGISENVNKFFRYAFCQESPYLTEKLLKDIWFNGLLRDFFNAIYIFTHSGIFQNLQDYSYYFLTRIGDEINLGKKDDVSLFLQLELPKSNKGEYGKVVYEKIKRECPAVTEIIEFTVNEGSTFYMDILYNTLRSYYEI